MPFFFFFFENEIYTLLSLVNYHFDPISLIFVICTCKFKFDVTVSPSSIFFKRLLKCKKLYYQNDRKIKLTRPEQEIDQI